MMTEAGMGSVVTIAGLINTAGTDLVFRPLEPTLKAQFSFA